MHLHECLEGYLTVRTRVDCRNPNTERPKCLMNKISWYSRWVVFAPESKPGSRPTHHLTSKNHSTWLSFFFDQDPDFNCLSTVSFIKYIIHNLWSEETSSGAGSLCLKANFPWMTGRPQFDSCALSEREENSSKHLRQFICRVDAHSQRLLLIVQGCLFQENAVSLRNTFHSTWLNNYKLMTFKWCN